MKNFLWTSALLCPLLAGAQIKLNVSGQVKENTGVQLYFYDRRNDIPILIDSAKVNPDGCYHVHLNLKREGAYLVGGRNEASYAFWANGKDLVMDIDEKGMPQIKNVDADNDVIRLVNHAIWQRSEDYHVDPRKATNNFRSTLEKVTRTNATTLGVLYPLSLFSFESDSAFVEGIIRSLIKTYPSNAMVKEYAAAAVRLRQGSPAPDFNYITASGEKRTLKATQRAKYLLVDFWASWCGPCRSGIPGIRKLYEEYKGKGLDVLSISLDAKDSDWKKALKEEGMNWAQGRVLDGGAFLRDTYRFNGVPYLALFDQNGKIVAANVFHEDLEQKFMELMGAPNPVTNMETEYTSSIPGEEEKRMLDHVFSRNLQQEYEAVVPTVSQAAFIDSYIHQLETTADLKGFQATKLSYWLPGFYSQLSALHASTAADKQKAYVELEANQLRYLRSILLKPQYEKYLRYRKDHPVLQAPVPLDPAVRTGRLANGFTYYIRRNVYPQNQVLMYLVNKTGSILEQEQERGLSHFLEHMNFNGTRHFPGNSLVKYLQDVGVRFGADLNAYTSFDETVYELPLPTAPGVVDSGLLIMRDWADDATLDSLEIEKERGVVLEEKRLGKGASERMNHAFLPLVANHSRYAERLPIGTDSILKNFTRADIVQFHKKWYRPEMQAIVIVGDIDEDKIEQQVRTLFADMPYSATAPKRPVYTAELTGKNQFMVQTDPEVSATKFQLLVKHKQLVARTADELLASMKLNLFNSMLAKRLQEELIAHPDPAFLAVSASVQNLIGGLDAFSFDVTAKDGMLKEAVQQGWRAMYRVEKYGFTAAELDLAKQAYVRSLEKAMQEKEKTTSAQYVSEYKSHFLKGTVSPGLTWEYDFAKSTIHSVSLSDINELIGYYAGPDNQDIFIEGPQKMATIMPTEVTVRQWLNEVQGENILAPVEPKPTKVLLADKPKQGSVVSWKVDNKQGIQEVQLSNGVKVVLKPTTFKNDEIRYYAYAPGGTSVYPDSSFLAAFLSTRIVSGFGLADFTLQDLARTLNDKIIDAGVFVGQRSQGVFGNASVRDIETALQLTYLQFTSPRADSQLFVNAINGLKASLLNRYADPSNVFADTISFVLGGYQTRNAPPRITQLDSLKLTSLMSAYKERFANADNFTFFFVGNIDSAAFRPLLEQYLGALPTLGHKEKAIDPKNQMPSGRLVKKVFKGSEDKSTVRMYIGGDDKNTPLNRILLNAIGEILQYRLLESLREQAGEVYSPSVRTTNTKFPTPRFGIQVSFGCAPENVDHLVSLVQQALDDLIQNGATAEDLQKFKSAYIKQTEASLNTNEFWLGYLSSQYENGEDISQVNHYHEYLDQLTLKTFKKAAAKYLGGKNMILFELFPKPL